MSILCGLIRHRQTVGRHKAEFIRLLLSYLTLIRASKFLKKDTSTPLRGIVQYKSNQIDERPRSCGI